MNITKAYNLILDKLQNWLESFVQMLPNLVTSVAVFIVFYIIARLGKKGINKLLTKFSGNTALNRLAATTSFIILISIGFFIILEILHLDKAVSSLLAGAGIIGLALGFAFQETAANIMSGIGIVIQKPFDIGDIVETNGELGKVEKISLRSTGIRTFQGMQVIVPNKKVFHEVLTNFSDNGRRRIDLSVGVSYGDDLEKVKELTEQTINSLPFVVDKEKTSLYYEEFGSSSINFKIVFWIDYPEQTSFLNARSKAIIAIKKAFDSNDISIPFPIRTLDFGIKGGKTLNQSLETLSLQNDQNK